jgi:hypothetical protein
MNEIKSVVLREGDKLGCLQQGLWPKETERTEEVAGLVHEKYFHSNS